MKYFELFELNPQFDIDQKALKKKYYKLSKESHPDFHTQGSEFHQAAKLEESTLINLAYKTLTDDRKLLLYILSEHGLLEEEKGNAIPQSFLMEMMDINEAIMDLQMDPDPIKKEQLIVDFKVVYDSEKTLGQSLKEKYDRVVEENVLIGLKDHYFKMKYLDRVLDSLQDN